MRWLKHSKRRIVSARFDIRWLFPISVIAIAGLLAFSAELKERTAIRSGVPSPALISTRR